MTVPYHRSNESDDDDDDDVNLSYINNNSSNHNDSNSNNDMDTTTSSDHHHHHQMMRGSHHHGNGNYDDNNNLPSAPTAPTSVMMMPVLQAEVPLQLSPPSTPHHLQTPTTTTTTTPQYHHHHHMMVASSPSAQMLHEHSSETTATTTSTMMMMMNNSSGGGDGTDHSNGIDITMMMKNNKSSANSSANNRLVHSDDSDSDNDDLLRKQQSRWYRLTHSQFMAHSIMVLHLLLFGGFCVLNPLATKHINTFIFSCWRILIMFLTMLPFAVLINRKFKFRHYQYNHIILNEESSSSSSSATTTNNTSTHNTAMPPSSQSSMAMTMNMNKSHTVDADGGCFSRIIISRVPQWREMGLMLLCGLMQVLNIVLFTYGTNLTSPTIAGILQPTTTIFTCLISVVLRREGFSVLKTLGVTVAFIGSVLTFVFSGLVHRTGNPFKIVGWTGRGIGGCILLVLGGICVSIFLIAQKTLLNRKIPPLITSIWSLGFASIFSIILSCVFINDLHVSKLPAITWIGVVYTGLFFGSINYAMTAYAAKLTSPTVISIYSTAYPLVSILFLLIFLQETSTWLVIIGAGVISLGVTLVAIGQRREGNWQQREALRKANLIGSENMGVPFEGEEPVELSVGMPEYPSETMRKMVASVGLKPKLERVVSSFDEYDDEDDTDLRKY